MIGIMGGTGLYQIEGIEVLESQEVETPFGRPSAPILLGRVGSHEVAFLPRHGKKHEILPSEINFRANVWALKSVGVRRILSVSAVGSLSETIRPGELVIPDQYIDFTKGRRAGTFFGDGLVAHVSTAEPSCSAFAAGVEHAARTLGVSLHRNQTYACVEGPRLGTRAESFFLRNAGGAQIVGMTNVPEAFLAREAQLCYCTLAVVTDYDCWMSDSSEHASVDKVMALYQKNIDRVKMIIERLILNQSQCEPCSCGKSLECAVVTREESLRSDQKKMLEFLRK